MQQYPSIKIKSYLTHQQILINLQDISYIAMIAPTPKEDLKAPLHVSMFLNTDEKLPKEVQKSIFDKFCKDCKLFNATDILSQIMPVGFADTGHDSAMPMLLIKSQDQMSIPHIPMFVLDFLADSDEFTDTKTKGLTGWSYAKE